MNTAYLVAGLAYGDEGKGATVDAICRLTRASHVIRYNGGPQAGHNVVTGENRHHTFSQFGSGSFAGAKTHLSHWMLINPISMQREAEHLHSLGLHPWSNLTVSPDCAIITPFHEAVNRLEQIHHGTHNSCGQGVGECRAFALAHPESILVAEDLSNEKLAKKKLTTIQNICLAKAAMNFPELFNHEEMTILKQIGAVEWCWKFYEDMPATWILSDSSFLSDLKSDVVFEGAQGVLLDEKFGEEGFNTWTDTTFRKAQDLLRFTWKGSTKRIGVLRTYFTRHGDGPFQTETDMIDYSEKMLPEPHNSGDGFQGAFRRGKFDMMAARYAILACGGVDGIALNHLDRFPGFDTKWLESQLRTEVLIEGHGPTANDRKWINF